MSSFDILRSLEQDPDLIAQTADLTQLSTLIRCAIAVAKQHKLTDTTHELRRALLALEIAAPEARQGTPQSGPGRLAH